MSGAKGRQEEVPASLGRERHHHPRTRPVLVFHKTSALVRSALWSMSETLDQVNAEVREDANRCGIVGAMARNHVLSESDLASKLARHSLDVKWRADALAEVQAQIQHCRRLVQGTTAKGNAMLSSWYLKQLTDLEHRLWSCKSLIHKENGDHLWLSCAQTFQSR